VTLHLHLVVLDLFLHSAGLRHLSLVSAPNLYTSGLASLTQLTNLEVLSRNEYHLHFPDRAHGMEAPFVLVTQVGEHSDATLPCVLLP
jgi:hypothetical protein